MKYCTSCKSVKEDHVTSCDCNWFEWNGRLEPLPIESVCKKCGSKDNLFYETPWSAGKYDFGNECECAECKKKVEDAIIREEAMKYLILDEYQGETIFCDGIEDVEEHLKHYTDEPWDYESAIKEVLILKLEEVTGEIKPEHFKPPYNTHLVFWDCEAYRVEEVINPELENDGCSYTLNW